MSPSMRPTLAPSSESATARLMAVVDLPTPPLPEPTAMTCLTPASGLPGGRSGAGTTTEDGLCDMSGKLGSVPEKYKRFRDLDHRFEYSNAAQKSPLHYLNEDAQLRRNPWIFRSHRHRWGRSP